jgi:hypothetical protein
MTIISEKLEMMNKIETYLKEMGYPYLSVTDEKNPRLFSDSVLINLMIDGFSYGVYIKNDSLVGLHLVLYRFEHPHSLAKAIFDTKNSENHLDSLIKKLDEEKNNNKSLEKPLSKLEETFEHLSSDRAITDPIRFKETLKKELNANTDDELNLIILSRTNQMDFISPEKVYIKLIAPVLKLWIGYDGILQIRGNQNKI